MSSHFLSGHHASGHFGSSHFGRLGIVPPTEPEIVHPMGSDPAMLRRRRRILREDDEILAIIMAFMETKDR
jgi:hypothetical protein